MFFVSQVIGSNSVLADFSCILFLFLENVQTEDCVLHFLTTFLIGKTFIAQSANKTCLCNIEYEKMHTYISR